MLRVSHCHSLKDKRSVLRKLTGRVHARYRLLIAEVAEQDTWQRIVVGFAVVGADRISVERTSADIASFIERTGLGELVADEHELLAYGNGPFGGPPSSMVGDSPAGATFDRAGDERGLGDESWIPDSWKVEDVS